MSMLLHGDCLDELKSVDDESIDLIFCDLPYGQTSCKWDCKIDLDKLWIEIMRVKKLNTPIFFTTTTKFGVELINSAPKKCYFRYDIVWVKSAPAGFLSAKKMPMRKHEMVYVFYEKLPFYDLSSHKHKFLRERKTEWCEKNGLYGEDKNIPKKEYKHQPPLPVSIVKEEPKQIIKGKNNTYNTEGRRKPLVREKAGQYNPPLPTSVVKEGQMIKEGQIYNGGKAMPCSDMRNGNGGGHYDPPLPTSVVKEKGCYGEKVSNSEAKYGQKCAQQYDPPLPTSVVKEPELRPEYKTDSELYGDIKRSDFERKGGESMYEPPLPTSVVKEEIIEPNEEYDKREKKTRNTIKKEDETYGKEYLEKKVNFRKYDPTLGGKGAPSHLYEPPLPTSVVKEIGNDNLYRGGKGKPLIDSGNASFGETGACYEPSLPNSILEIKSTRGKHSTEKPVALMEWVLKYYSKEGDIVLDPTMGSGSTGVACKNMNRLFIGIEKDPEIYEVAVNRIEE